MRLLPRALFLTVLALALVGLLSWPKHLIPGGTSSIVLASTKAQQAVAAARTALNNAVNIEKETQTKEAALAADMALQQFRAAAALRVAEIRVSLKDLAQQAEASGKSSSNVSQIEALETELSELEPAVVNTPTPVVTPETEPNNTSATANVLNVSASAQPCAIVSAAINPGGDLDFFTFTGAPAGSRIWIETDTGGTQNAGATSRDTVIDLLAADGDRKSVV